MVHSGMASIRPVQIWIYIVASSQGPEGLLSSRNSVVFRGSENRSQSGIQLVGKGVTEEKV